MKYSELFTKCPSVAGGDGCPCALLWVRRWGSVRGWIHPGALLQAPGPWSVSQSPRRCGTATPQSLWQTASEQETIASSSSLPSFLPREFQSSLLSQAVRIPADSLPFPAEGAAPPQSPHSEPQMGQKSGILRSSAFIMSREFRPWAKCVFTLHLSLQHSCRACLGLLRAGKVWFASTWTLLITNLPPSSPQHLFFPCCSVKSNTMGKMNHFTSVCPHLALPKAPPP